MTESILEEVHPIAARSLSGADAGLGAPHPPHQAALSAAAPELRRQRPAGTDAQHHLRPDGADRGGRACLGRDLRPAELHAARPRAPACRTLCARIALCGAAASSRLGGAVDRASCARTREPRGLRHDGKGLDGRRSLWRIGRRRQRRPGGPGRSRRSGSQRRTTAFRWGQRRRSGRERRRGRFRPGSRCHPAAAGRASLCSRGSDPAVESEAGSGHLGAEAGTCPGAGRLIFRGSSRTRQRTWDRSLCRCGSPGKRCGQRTRRGT